MEDTLKEEKRNRIDIECRSLNPCSNGRYSQREQNLRILEFRGFDNSKTYKIGFC